VTSLVRRVAGGLTIVEAAWFLYAYLDAPATGCFPPGCPSFIPLYSVVSLVLVLILIVVGGLGFWGASVAYVAGAVLSAAALAIAGYTVVVVRGYGYLSTASNDAIIGVAFALVALLVNIDAMRSKGGISEQANPMNLPVFG
jgi:hypothetical protein